MFIFKILYIMSSTTRLTIGTVVGFLSGLGLMKGLLDPSNATFWTNNIESIFGGILAAISLIGFIEHHLHPAANQSSTTVTATQTTTAPITPNTEVVQTTS